MKSINSKIKVVIPARFGSSRLPGKPLIDLCGKPMVIRVANRVSEALPLADLWIATDDKRIEDVAIGYGYQVMLTGDDHESGMDRIAEVAKNLSWASDVIIINVQGDEPLIDVGLLQKFAQFCITNEFLAMASVMVPVDCWQDINDPNVVKVTVNKAGQATAFSRSPIPYCRDVPLADWPTHLYNRHIGIYAYKARVLTELSASTPCALEMLEKLEQLRALWFGHSISMFNWLGPIHAGVDCLDDVNRVRKVLNNSISE
jgi:3-deoxy-manno-octulosonate cytidylyltransferase (CMP-KDO synthetase)